MSIALFDLLPRVRPWAPGVSDAAAMVALRDAAIEFCEKTKLWKWEDTVAVLATDPSTFSLTMPTDAALHDLETSSYALVPLTPKAPQDLDEDLPGWQDSTYSAGQPCYITQVVQNTFTLVPAPSEDGDFFVRARLKPSQTATTIPDFMGEYREALGWGALSRVLVTPGQPYTSPDMAAFYAGRWMQKLDSLGTKSRAGQQRARTRTKMSFF